MLCSAINYKNIIYKSIYGVVFALLLTLPSLVLASDKDMPKRLDLVNSSFVQISNIQYNIVSIRKILLELFPQAKSTDSRECLLSYYQEINSNLQKSIDIRDEIQDRRIDYNTGARGYIAMWNSDYSPTLKFLLERSIFYVQRAAKCLGPDVKLELLPVKRSK